MLFLGISIIVVLCFVNLLGMFLISYCCNLKVLDLLIFICYYRALDNLMYAAGVSVARDETASYVSWANSTLVSPW